MLLRDNERKLICITEGDLFSNAILPKRETKTSHHDAEPGWSSTDHPKQKSVDKGCP